MLVDPPYERHESIAKCKDENTHHSHVELMIRQLVSIAHAMRDASYVVMSKLSDQIWDRNQAVDCRIAAARKRRAPEF